jgi:hypothetical protein
LASDDTRDPIVTRKMVEKIVDELGEIDQAAYQAEPDLEDLRERITRVKMLAAATLRVLEDD